MGFSALQKASEIHVLSETVKIRVATLPALAGLKLIAYGDRRPAVRRDAADLLHIASNFPWTVEGQPLSEDAQDALRDEVVDFGSLGAFLLGREMLRIFESEALARIRWLSSEASDPWSDLVTDACAARSRYVEDRERELTRVVLNALQKGLGA